MGSQQNEKLPQHPDELTPDWFSDKLGAKVKSAENTRTIWGTGSKLFFTITYDDENATNLPTYICVKGVFDPKMIQEQPWTVTLAQREAGFFSTLAPNIKNVVFPNGWWGGENETQGISIMDDLTKQGCTFPPEVAEYSVEQVKNGVATLAGLHAQYWGQSQEDHPWIWNNYDPSVKFMAGPWDEMARDPGRPVLPESLKDGKRGHDALDRYFAERNARFRTLLHGDTHIGNIYFLPDGQMGFLDWSAFHFASCFQDIVYHMTALLSVENRRAHEMEILDHYLETLHRLGGPKFDRHNDPEVMLEYNRSFMTNVVWLICPYSLQSKERVDMLCERAVAGFVDHDVIETILGQPRPS
ncbi:ecdysteroid kinase domain-containing protein [Sarocladium implicatum]|nr:ecdysteroid kinase domain-containing protein [Sarocladium implicatum]